MKTQPFRDRGHACARELVDDGEDLAMLLVHHAFDHGAERRFIERVPVNQPDLAADAQCGRDAADQVHVAGA